MTGKGAKILAVDDEVDILTLLSFNLKKAGFTVVTAEDGPEAIELAGSERPGLIILDIMLPNMEGTEVLKRLKAKDETKNIPVIMLTAKGEEIDRIVGLELGADDYITKPFSPRELILRVKAIFKRTKEGMALEPPEGGAHKVVTFRELAVDHARHRVTISGKAVELTAIEFKLLTELINAEGRVLSRDTILDRAWGRDCFVTPRTVDTHIRRLRSKLKSAGAYIETVRGAGYRFTEEDEL
ncbi:MAG: response regulator [Thermodesulfobacteriota bacterium]